MDDTNKLPDWVKRQNEERAAEKARKDAEAQARHRAAVSVKSDGPGFWKRFTDRAVFDANAVKHLQGEELAATASVSSGAEEALHLHVNRQSVTYGPELSRMNLWYARGGAVIRCSYQAQPMRDITLMAQGESVVALLNGDVYTAEELADHIIEWMAERVKAKRRRAS